MKQRTVLIVSILVGVLAFALTRHYFHAKLLHLKDLEDQLYAGVKKVEVIAVGRDLPAGTALEKGDLRIKQSFDRDVSRNTVLPEDVDQILGKKLLFGMQSGETLLWSHVDVASRLGLGLSATVRIGLRAASVTVSGASAVSGLVQPNDHVDVLGTFYFPSKANPAETEAVTLTMLQDVTVLATGQSFARRAADMMAARSSGYNTVTLEVSPREAELLVFCETMKGRLTLTLRNQDDISFEKNLPEINFQQVEQSLPDLNKFRQEEIRHKARY